MNTVLKIRSLSLILLAAGLTVWSGCKREYDSPPEKEIPVGNVLTLADLKAMHTGTNISFTDDYSVFAVVTADERSGNLYRNVYVQDNTGAINLRLLTSGGIYQGDSVRIYLRGTLLSRYNGMLQLDSVDVDRNIIKQKTGVQVAPQVVTIDQINTTLQSRLIKLENVEFASNELGLTYADAVNQANVNRTLKDCNGNSILLRTSGYSSFAGTPLPHGNGSIIAVVGEFNGTMQLYLRTPSEAIMNAPRCTGGGPCSPVASVNEPFDNVTDNADIAISCWTSVATAGNRFWRGRVFNAEKYVQATAYNSFDASNVSWLVSPPIQASATKTLSFQSAKSFWFHNGLSVWISTNFDGVNVNSATWNSVSAVLANSSNADNAWVNSGAIPLAGYLPAGYTGSFHIAFKYEGNAGAGQTSTYRIDNVQITD